MPPTNNSKLDVVIIGGGVGSSTFTKALKGLPIKLTTVVSAFDDGGSTGAIRRDYKGFALGDFRQCVFESMNLSEILGRTLNYRFGSGNLFGVNIGNIFIKSFLKQFRNERHGVFELHRTLGIKNNIYPVSYAYVKLCAELKNGTMLNDQKQIAEYLSFSTAPIKKIFLSKKAAIAPEVSRAIIEADILLFAPGHFFTSLMPHLAVSGFKEAWQRSRAKKIWFVNLLAHRGQDSFFSLRDYISWFERGLGKRPFDTLVLNKKIRKQVLARLKDRFVPVQIKQADLKTLKRNGVDTIVADLVSEVVRKQGANDTVLRAPLRHDTQKIRNFFLPLLNATKHYH